MHRSAASAVQVSGVDMDAKLALVEFLLASTDLQASARRALELLAAQLGIEQAAVAVVEKGTGHIQLVSSLSHV